MFKKVFCLILAVLFSTFMFASFANAADGDVMVFKATSDGDDQATVKYKYHIFSREPYEFKAGDYLQYDVYLDSNSAGLGAIEIWVSGATPDCFRDIATWKDQNGIKGHPNADLTQYAYKKWYTRKLPVPESMDGAVAMHWNVAVEKTSVNETYTVYYDNIKIVDKDGKVKKVIYENGDPAVNDANGGPGYINVSVAKAANPAPAAAATTEPAKKADNPKTGDIGLLPYAVLAVASASGLVAVRRRRK